MSDAIKINFSENDIISLQDFAVAAGINSYDLQKMIEYNSVIEGGTINIYDRYEDEIILLKASDLLNFQEKYNRFISYIETHLNDRGQEIDEEYLDRDYGDTSLTVSKIISNSWIRSS